MSRRITQSHIPDLYSIDHVRDELVKVNLTSYFAVKEISWSNHNIYLIIIIIRVFSPEIPFLLLRKPLRTIRFVVHQICKAVARKRSQMSIIKREKVVIRLIFRKS